MKIMIPVKFYDEFKDILYIYIEIRKLSKNCGNISIHKIQKF